MEIVPPQRQGVAGTISVTAKGIRSLGAEVVDAGKLEGCKATSVGALLKRMTRILSDPGVSGRFVAADGLCSEPIPMPDLLLGLIVHSDRDGAALPQSLGGPLRVVYPPGVGSQRCKNDGRPMAVNVKDCVRLELFSAFETTDVTLSRELSQMAPQLMLELNEHHGGTLAALGAHHAALADVASACVTSIDARGLTLTVVVESVLRVEKPGILVAFPRPLTSASEVMPYVTEEMSAAAYGALGLGFRLRHGAFARRASRSPWAAAVAVLGVAGAVGLLVAARRRAR